jgi:hypothetical protein
MAFDEYKSQGTVNAEQIEESRSVITPQGSVTGYPGQWEVRYPDGNVRVLDDEAFQTEWGGGSGESEEETPEGASQSTQPNAGAEPITPVTTAGAASESDSSRDSDTDSDTDSDKESDSTTRADKTTEKDTDSPV